MGAHSRPLQGVVFVFGGSDQREIRTYEGFSDYHIRVWDAEGRALSLQEVAEGVKRFEEVAKRWRKKKKFILTTTSWGVEMKDLVKLLAGLPENCQLPNEVLDFIASQQEQS